MQSLNTFQIQQKVYDIMPYDEEFKGVLGNIPQSVMMLVFGDSGNGKSEFTMRLAKSLCKHKIYVDWVSYEQGHGLDMQMLLKRNNMIEVGSYFQVSDPNWKKDDDTSYLHDLDKKIGKRGSSDVFVIDSVQYMDITVKDYKWLKNRHKDKGFIFISHKEGKYPEGTTAKKIGYDGGCRILVKNFIAIPEKNRYGGNDPYFVWEERARMLEQKFFLEYDKKDKKTLFTQLEMAENRDEEEGVIANE